MRHFVLLIIPTTLLVAACAPALPAPVTETPSLTPAPTRTLTPAPTATITPTPAPSLPFNFPPEFAAMIGDADYRIDSNNHVWVTAADGGGQDWFPIESDGADWRRSDRWLVDHAPNQQWWEGGIAKGSDFDIRNLWVVVPEPDHDVELTVTAADGIVYTIKGPIMLTPDKNNPNKLIQWIFRRSITSSDGWSFETNLVKLCDGRFGCENGLSRSKQYEISNRL